MERISTYRISAIMPAVRLTMSTRTVGRLVDTPSLPWMPSFRPSHAPPEAVSSRAGHTAQCSSAPHPPFPSIPRVTRSSEQPRRARPESGRRAAGERPREPTGERPESDPRATPRATGERPESGRRATRERPRERPESGRRATRERPESGRRAAGERADQRPMRRLGRPFRRPAVRTVSRAAVSCLPFRSPGAFLALEGRGAALRQAPRCCCSAAGRAGPELRRARAWPAAEAPRRGGSVRQLRWLV